MKTTALVMKERSDESYTWPTFRWLSAHDLFPKYKYPVDVFNAYLLTVLKYARRDL